MTVKAESAGPNRLRQAARERRIVSRPQVMEKDPVHNTGENLARP
jgi:hypothetical protein